MSSQKQHTVWLWTEGVFARRIIYFLLMKKLAPKVSSILNGCSISPTLTIVPVQPGPALSWQPVNAGDPTPPKHASNPCLRITDLATKEERHIYESTSILLYLEELYPEHPLQPRELVDRAKMMDFLGQINLVAIDTNYKLRNTIPEHGMAMGLMPESQRKETAVNAEAQEKKGYEKLLSWAHEESFRTTGWLTPGMDTPGLVDIALAPNVRFVDLVYGIKTFDGEKLRGLQDWYEKFQSLEWWQDFEERDGILPGMLSFGKTSRAQWITGLSEH